MRHPLLVSHSLVPGSLRLLSPSGCQHPEMLLWSHDEAAHELLWPLWSPHCVDGSAGGSGSFAGAGRLSCAGSR
eukprot:16440904-Heterocapsa_arctica.AAC.1